MLYNVENDSMLRYICYMLYSLANGSIRNGGMCGMETGRRIRLANDTFKSCIGKNNIIRGA